MASLPCASPTAGCGTMVQCARTRTGGARHSRPCGVCLRRRPRPAGRGAGEGCPHRSWRRSSASERLRPRRARERVELRSPEWIDGRIHLQRDDLACRITALPWSGARDRVPDVQAAHHHPLRVRADGRDHRGRERRLRRYGQIRSSRRSRSARGSLLARAGRKHHRARARLCFTYGIHGHNSREWRVHATDRPDRRQVMNARHARRWYRL
jgi:hypothetical protein